MFGLSDAGECNQQLIDFSHLEQPFETLVWVHQRVLSARFIARYVNADQGSQCGRINVRHICEINEQDARRRLLPYQILKFEKVVNGDRPMQGDYADILAATGAYFDAKALRGMVFHRSKNSCSCVSI